MTTEQEKDLRYRVAELVKSESKLIERMLQLRASKYIDFVIAELSKDKSK